jgi:glycosyltransferase involved in cell wall biosynthesis
MRMSHDHTRPDIGKPMAPLHVLMTADAVGGVLQYALDLAGGLSARGVRTTLAMLGPPPDEAQRRAASGVPGLQLVETSLPLDWLARDVGTAGQAALAVSELARRHGVDLVHLNTPSLACVRYGVPVVSVLHSCLASWWANVKRGPLPDDFRWRTELMARGIACTDALVCPSAALGDEIERIYGRRPLVVHNGRAPVAPSVPEPPAVFAFTAGRLWDDGKDIATLDAAAQRIDLPVFAAGPTEGPNGTRIELSRLRSLGPIGSSEVRSLLARQPIFVTSALYEPFGLAVLEAAQAGCALVLSDIPTFRELWDGAAIFVPPRDADDFAESLSRLVKDPGRRATLAAAAQERSARYTVEAMAMRMLNVYAAVAAPARLSNEGAAA